MNAFLWLLLLHNLLIPVTAEDQCSLEEKVAIVMRNISSIGQGCGAFRPEQLRLCRIPSKTVVVCFSILYGTLILECWRLRRRPEWFRDAAHSFASWGNWRDWEAGGVLKQFCYTAILLY